MLSMLRRSAVFGGHRCSSCGAPVQAQLDSRQFRVFAARGFGKVLERKSKKAGNPNELKPHKVSPRLHVPDHIQRPTYVDTGEMPWGKEKAIHDAEGIAKMRAAGKLAAEVLRHAGTLVKPGVETDFIDRQVHQMIVDNNAYPSPLTYGQFPKSVCTSVNECVCHGIPDARELQEGDIVNIDVTVYLNGYHGDTSAMFFAGQPSERAKWLCDVNRESLHEAIRQCGPGVPMNTIGKTIEAIADRHKLRIIADFVGHGVGRSFHSEPPVHPKRNGDRSAMVPGQTFTIEPIFADGNGSWQMWRDGWTVVTKDRSWTAQHEHTVLITENGHEVLTQL